MDVRHKRYKIGGKVITARPLRNYDEKAEYSKMTSYLLVTTQWQIDFFSINTDSCIAKENKYSHLPLWVHDGREVLRSL